MTAASLLLLPPTHRQLQTMQWWPVQCRVSSGAYWAADSGCGSG